MPRFSHLFLLLTLSVSSCRNPQSETTGIRKDTVVSDLYDLDQIQQTGELIILTLYGPSTYYENQGYEGGIQFRIAQEFAKDIGARIRIEIAPDEASLIKMLNKGEADLVAYNLPISTTYDNVVWLGDSLETRKSGWVVRKSSPLLSEEVQSWFTKNRKKVADIYRENLRLSTSSKRVASIHRRAVMKNPARGIISDYDALFKRHARALGWDWKLLAAQAYQESAFDPQAQSWAGACGLMQLMPSTASLVGLDISRIFIPEDNIRSSVKYLRILDNQFRDIKNPAERIHFILASYNCGPLHVRDAMALAQKHGKNPQIWKGNVENCILLLQDPRYNHDAVVKNGYCHGSETYHYVQQIMERFKAYRKGK